MQEQEILRPYLGKNVVFVGAGQGRSLKGVEDFATKHFSPISFTAVNKKDGDDPLGFLKEYDSKTTMFIKNEGIPPREMPVPYITAMPLFMQLARAKGVKMIGVTGTKGKGTTSTLIYKILQAAEVRSHLGGNIGNSVFNLYDDLRPNDWVVIELSSFQLIDLHETSVDIGVCLQINPEHLNWHSDLNEYVSAKANLFRYMPNESKLYYLQGNDLTLRAVSESKAHKTAFCVPKTDESPTAKEAAYIDDEDIYFAGNHICKVNDVALPGRHNLENVCAAISATWEIIGGNVEAIKTVLASFSGLAYHTEVVAEVNGVKYINDSYATTPEAAIAAIKAFAQPKVVIIGGSRKNVDLTELCRAVAANNVKHAVVIGDTSDEIVEKLSTLGYNSITTGKKTMGEIVEAARSHAEAGEIVLMSPGCASFGLFKDYVDRAQQFNQVVQSLAATA